MEIACKVTASIPGTCINILLLERYKKLVEETYTEPKNEEILGSYINKLQNEELEDRVPRREKKRKRKEKAPVKTKDIRRFFTPVNCDIPPKGKTNVNIIEID